RRRGLTADIALQLARAEAGEKAAIHGSRLHNALCAEIAVGQHGLSAILVDDRVKALSGEADRFLPSEPVKAAWSFRADAPQRVEQSLGTVDTVEEAVHLRAEDPARPRVLTVTGKRNRDSIIDRDLPRTRVGAVVWTGPANDTGSHATGLPSRR